MEGLEFWGLGEQFFNCYFLGLVRYEEQISFGVESFSEFGQIMLWLILEEKFFFIVFWFYYERMWNIEKNGWDVCFFG